LYWVSDALPWFKGQLTSSKQGWPAPPALQVTLAALGFQWHILAGFSPRLAACSPGFVRQGRKSSWPGLSPLLRKSSPARQPVAHIQGYRQFDPTGWRMCWPFDNRQVVALRNGSLLRFTAPMIRSAVGSTPPDDRSGLEQTAINQHSPPWRNRRKQAGNCCKRRGIGLE